MGKWDRRYSRRRYNHDPQRYMFRENGYYPELDGPDSAPDNVPSWEKEFCASIGCVPWRKLLFTKKCMFGHENVLNWDDSAGEEAFRHAKDQFWAKINGMCSQVSPPDPDIYIEKVDWNSRIDSELIEEVDRAYFNPDLNKEGTVQKECESSDDNPWESKRIESGEDLNCEGWGSLQLATNKNESGNSHTEDNPWEQGFTQGSQQVNWNQWRSPEIEHSNNDANLWEQGKNSHLGDPKSYSHGWNSGKSKYLHTNYANRGERGHFQERRFTDEERWKNQPQPRGGRNWSDGCRKRENTRQGGSEYKSSRYRADDYQAGQNWSRERANKRVSFADSRY